MSGQTSPVDFGRASKVPIPRLERRNDPTRPVASGRQRVSRACLTCRARKIKCNGVQPRCQNCLDNAAPCIYAANRKDRLKTATDHNQGMIQLLKHLQRLVPEAEQARIEETLQAVVKGVAGAGLGPSSPLERQDVDPNSEMDLDSEHGEANISAEVGSNDDLDIVDEDLLQNERSRATGFFGKPSEIQWFRKLHYEADNKGTDRSLFEGPYGPPGDNDEANAERISALRHRQLKNPSRLTHTSSCSFYLDHEQVRMDFFPDPLELPPFETAEKLLKIYMDTVQNTFPFLAKKTFVNQFYQYYASLAHGRPYALPQDWQAMLNLVFAIAATYTHYTEADGQSDERVHLMYHSRACSLCFKDPWWFSQPDLPQLQMTALLAFYYLAIGHVNRAWVVSGMSLRCGYALGLHIRNEDQKATAVKKEILSRMWWAVYSLERSLSAITGRPSVGLERVCSVPFPLPLSTEEIDDAIIISRFDGKVPRFSTNHFLSSESSSAASSSRAGSRHPAIRTEPTNSGSYLNHMIKIGMVAQKVLLELYSANLVTKSWEDVQTRIANLSVELDVCVADLPLGLSFDPNNVDRYYKRERITLQMFYYNIKILITRPCLCRSVRRIPNQSQSSSAFHQSTSEECVATANAIAMLFPDDPESDHGQIYHLGPWWAIVHYMMQAIAVLLLDITYKAITARSHHDVVLSLKKLLRCLRAIGANNGMARRAYTIVIDLSKKMTTSVDSEVNDLLREEIATAAAMPAAPDPQPTTTTPSFELPQVYEPLTTESAFEMPQLYEPRTRDQQQQQQKTQSTSYPNPTSGLFSQDIFEDPSIAGSSPQFQDLFTMFPDNSVYLNMFYTGFDEQNPLPPFGSNATGPDADYTGPGPPEWKQ
ncbi:hypothetical protein EJ04DRAFT_576398 [Polyplosphaeria fusca]|uniref:Zn(2)-C6 fungal-type domain-containing protein n=1 Tax=Polyplosphaeria fusca TaxID=682080 RepID=A0A9P4QWE3_9PLEO|nr:hypothetical protein EJ04DRAFT_576398 [Polyplosphaeria fusca]